jgi:hypothetical protein
VSEKSEWVPLSGISQFGCVGAVSGSNGRSAGKVFVVAVDAGHNQSRAVQTTGMGGYRQYPVIEIWAIKRSIYDPSIAVANGRIMLADRMNFCQLLEGGSPRN